MTSRHALSRAPGGRATAVLVTLATACGLWFGITAPDVSPVSAPAATPTTQVDQGDPAPVQDRAPVVPPDDAGPGRRGGGR
jgi:hypothetical protein